MQINGDVRFTVASETDRICLSRDNFSEPWVGFFSWCVQTGECRARDRIVNPWQDTSANAQIWNRKGRMDGSLEVFYLRVMMRAAKRTRSNKCCLELGFKYCQTLSLAWSNWHMHAEEGVCVRTLNVSFGVSEDVISISVCLYASLYAYQTKLNVRWKVALTLFYC